MSDPATPASAGSPPTDAPPAALPQVTLDALQHRARRAGSAVLGAGQAVGDLLFEGLVFVGQAVHHELASLMETLDRLLYADGAERLGGDPESESESESESGSASGSEDTAAEDGPPTSGRAGASDSGERTGGADHPPATPQAGYPPIH